MTAADLAKDQTYVLPMLGQDDLARIELAPADLARLGDPALRTKIVTYLRELGFRYITLDLEGFRSGSFQTLVPTEELTRFGQARS